MDLTLNTTFYQLYTDRTLLIQLEKNMRTHRPTYRIGLLMPFNDFFAQSQTAFFGKHVIDDIHDMLETEDINIKTRRVTPFRWNSNAGNFILERVNTINSLIIDISYNEPTMYYSFGIISLAAQINQ